MPMGAEMYITIITKSPKMRIVTQMDLRQFTGNSKDEIDIKHSGFAWRWFMHILVS